MAIRKALLSGGSDMALSEGGSHRHMDQALEHLAQHAQRDPGLTRGGQEFLVRAHPPIACEPSKCPFHHPAPFVAAQRTAILRLGPFAVASVGVQSFQSPPAPAPHQGPAHLRPRARERKSGERVPSASALGTRSPRRLVPGRPPAIWRCSRPWIGPTPHGGPYGGPVPGGRQPRQP